MKNISKKVLGACFAGAVVVSGLAGAGIGYLAQPEPVILVKQVDVIKEVNVTQEVQVEVEVPVEDTSFVQLACDRLVYEDIEECKTEIVAEEAALVSVWEDIEAKGLRELEREGIFKDEDDLEYIKFYKDFEDVVVVSSNYDNEYYKFKVQAKVEDVKRDIKKTVEFTVKVEDGDAKILKVVKV